MRIRLAIPDDLHSDDKEAALNAALESVTRANQGMLARGQIPTFERAAGAGAVRWRPEPPGDEHFDLASTVIGRKWGDCDDLAPWHAASLRVTGQDPEATPYVYKSGPDRWHAVVRRGDGSTDDPSRAAGMGSVGGDDYGGPFWPAMFGDRMALASYPLRQGWAGRVDVPSATLPMMYSALHHGRGPRGAIVGALRCCGRVCQDDADELHLLRVAGLHDLLVGVPGEVVGEALAHHGADVGFFGALAPAAMSLAAPVASKVLSAYGMGPKGGGGGGGGGAAPGGAAPPGTAMHCPGGPIIVRF